MKIHALRLRPGDDLRLALEAYVRAERLDACFVITTVGSLRCARLRLAGGAQASNFEGPFEIVSLVGTLGPDGAHLHMALADAQGQTRGGHALAGCIVHTTAEVVLGEEESLRFARERDPATGFEELAVKRP